MNRPTTLVNLTEMEDVAEEKALKYGHSFLENIKEFCAENSWKSDFLPEESMDVCPTVPVGFSVVDTFSDFSLLIWFCKIYF